MRCLLRRISRKRNGGVIVKEEIIEADRISIGRQPGQGIRLDDIRLALQHAVIYPERLEGRSYVLRSEVSGGLRVGEETVQRVGLEPGCIVQLGSWLLGVVAPQSGFDLVLEMERVPEQETDDRGRRKEGVRKGLSTRASNWLLFAAIFGMTFVLPMAGFFYPPVGGVLRTWMPWMSDRAWKSGELSSLHYTKIGNDCGQCHQSAFKSVANTACLECHNKGEHVLKHHVSLDPKVFSPSDNECAMCHKEHNGSNAKLVSSDDGLCTDCHADIKERVADSVLQNVDGTFGDHPEFKASFFVNETNKEQFQRIAMTDPTTLKQVSNLQFSHKVHMDPEGILGSDQGRDKTAAPERRLVKLSCESCHQLDESGQYMQPVTFKERCNVCHSLTFDVDAPELPHGKADEVLPFLVKYYTSHPDNARTALHSSSANEVLAPGRASSSRAPLVPAEFAESVAKERFEGSTSCGRCHTVFKTGDHLLSWEIRKVRSPRHWYPKASFDHGAHRAFDCKGCHKASESRQSEDVLIGNIAQCRECHGDMEEQRKVASSCISCHRFHASEKFDAAGQKLRSPDAMGSGWHAGMTQNSILSTEQKPASKASTPQ